MPAEGLDWLPGDDLLTDDEVVRLIAIGVERLGVREVRFTGGEPLVRRGLVDIVRRTPRARPRRRDVASPPTARPGPDRRRARRGRARPGQRQPRHRPPRHVPRDHPARPARRRRSTASAAAEAAGLGPVKVNAVLLRGVNDDQAPELLRWCLDARLRAAVHRADAARRPARLGPRRRWSPPTRSSPRLEQRVRADAGRPSRGGAPRPSCSSSTAARPRSA